VVSTSRCGSLCITSSAEPFSDIHGFSVPPGCLIYILIKDCSPPPFPASAVPSCLVVFLQARLFPFFTTAEESVAGVRRFPTVEVSLGQISKCLVVCFPRFDVSLLLFVDSGLSQSSFAAIFLVFPCPLRRSVLIPLKALSTGTAPWPQVRALDLPFIENSSIMPDPF